MTLPLFSFASGMVTAKFQSESPTFKENTMLDFFEALIRDGAGEKYFENPAALLFVIAPLLRTVKRISEVTYSKSSLTLTMNILKIFC